MSGVVVLENEIDRVTYLGASTFRVEKWDGKRWLINPDEVERTALISAAFARYLKQAKITDLRSGATTTNAA